MSKESTSKSSAGAAQAQQPLKSSKESMMISASSALTTVLDIDYVLADTIGLSFKSMPGNQPNTYGNFVSIWQNANSIPWNSSPLSTKPIPNNTPHGSVVFDGLDINNHSYIIGYSVGPTLTDNRQKYGNVAATAFVPENSSGQNSLFQPSLAVVFIGTTSVAFSFNLAEGTLPQTNGAWAGIWRSAQPSYNNPPDAVTPISMDVSSGSAAFNNINIGRGLTYTIGLFLSGYKGVSGQNVQTALACSVTFTNS